ncbi:MAG: DUF3748 domain-containing protein [Cytophagales bacterium]|nr:DUF3748 domain-containing protein [Armatimonadota bacterium]
MGITQWQPREAQVTQGPGGRILTNAAVWSPDSQWIVYDTRSDTEGSEFDGTSIERVHATTGEVRTVYTARNGAHCGVATYHPALNRVLFILGPENPTPDWQYGPSHRQGVWVEVDRPGVARSLEARDLIPPFTPGALRGGSHVHMYSPDGALVSFTYDDALLPSTIQRNIGVSLVGVPIAVSKSHPRNHDGTAFSVLVTRTTADPAPGSDAIQRACEEGWVGTDGYRREDGTHQKRALAFQGMVRAPDGAPVCEVFIVDLPDDLTAADGNDLLEGTTILRPAPPSGTRQRRLTFTTGRRFPGICGPRHWLRSSPEGSRIACLMRDESGYPQIWTVSPSGGLPAQVTHDPWGVASAFTWSPEGRFLAYAADNSVFVVEVASGQSHRLTPRTDLARAPLPLACVFSPDNTKIAYLRRVPDSLSPTSDWRNQIFVIHLEPTAAID